MINVPTASGTDYVGSPATFFIFISQQFIQFILELVYFIYRQ